MKVGVVDIGTNSMRLLITDGVVETGRWVEVTGLGRGIDRSGRLDADAMDETIEVLEYFGRLMDENDVEKRAALATSASRDAANREDFFDRARGALGVRPELISGEREARLAFAGATAHVISALPQVVSDIGGGSTELVSADSAVSVDIGSVRLTDRILVERPAPRDQLDAAREHVSGLFADVAVPEAGSHIGVAGTWTSLAAIALDLPRYDSDLVHGSILLSSALTDLVQRLAALDLEQTAAIPSLDPKRAPVILAGAVVAEAVVSLLGVRRTRVSERDTLDGAAAELLALA